MHILLLIGLLVAGNETMKDLVAMQGEWKVVWVERAGRKQNETVDTPLRFTIRGARCCFDSRDLVRFELRLDPTCTPKVVDLTVPASALTSGRTFTCEGIYQIDGDTLTWCWRRTEGLKERPLTFDASKDAGGFAECLVRVKR